MKLIRFGAIWCPACLIMRPRYNKVLENFKDITSYEYDYDMDENLVNEYKIGKILPEAILYDDNDTELERMVGEVSLDKLMDIIKKYRK